MTSSILPFSLPSSASEEIRGAEFGDARLTRRLAVVVSRLEQSPGVSFPKGATSPSDLEATYRFFSNDKVTSAAILAPHLAATRERAKTVPVVVAVHDTTEIRFGGTAKRTGLGPLMRGGQGFFLQAALLVGVCACGAVPLGLGGYEVLVRKNQRKKPKTKGEKQKLYREVRSDSNRESQRWLRVAKQTEAALAEEAITPIHVADREGDNYDFFGPLVAAQSRFVVRLAQPRVVKEIPEGFTPSTERPRPHIDDAVAHIAVRTTRNVPISMRVTSGGQRRVEQPRDARVAALEIRAARVQLQRPSVSQFKDDVTLQVVDVLEVNAPDGQDPVHWRLLTTEPIDTVADVERIVDIYRARWLIEEFFKALKTGCSIEERQLETQARLENALAAQIPIAWLMLVMRSVTRDAPQTPAAHVLPQGILALLIYMATTPRANRWGIRLNAQPTVDEALRAIARIGGHLPHNGPPGWLTIRRGLDDVMKLLAVCGSVLPGCDQ